MNVFRGRRGKNGILLAYSGGRLLSGWVGSLLGCVVSYLASSAYWITAGSYISLFPDEAHTALAQLGE